MTVFPPGVQQRPVAELLHIRRRLTAALIAAKPGSTEAEDLAHALLHVDHVLHGAETAKEAA